MSSREKRICPYCGNDRIIEVATFAEGKDDALRSFCAGTLGCRAWWTAEGPAAPTPLRAAERGVFARPKRPDPPRRRGLR